MIRRASRQRVLLSRRKTSACHSLDQSSKLLDMVQLDMVQQFGGRTAKAPLDQVA
jgi:hypothetical protein